MLEKFVLGKPTSNLVITTSKVCEMSLAYLKDVSLMLSIVSAVREGCLERHLQAEREFLKLIFASDHVNYARFFSVNSDKPRALLTNNCWLMVWVDQRWNIQHKKKTRLSKGTAGPFHSGYNETVTFVVLS